MAWSPPTIRPLELVRTGALRSGQPIGATIGLVLVAVALPLTGVQPRVGIAIIDPRLT